MSNRKELVGTIRDRKLDQVRNKKSKHFGNQYWRLAVNIKNEEIKELLVFKDFITNQDIWEDIKQRKYLDKRYLFKVQRKPGAGQIFRLLDWEELSSLW